MARELTAVCLVIVLSPVASADDRRPLPKDRWVEGADAVAALEPWSHCNDLDDFRAAAEIGESLRVRAAPDGVDLSHYSAGSGRWAVATDTTVRLTHDRCSAIGLTIGGGKESLLGGVKLLALDGATKPTLDQVTTPSGASVVDAASVDSVDLAAARVLLQLATEASDGEPVEPSEGTGVLGRAWPVQPEHGGKPRGSPAALWSPAMLAAAAVDGPALTDEGGEAFDAIHTGRVRDPVPLVRKGRWQLWELRFRARLGGGLLAVYDRKTARHRWIWATEYDNAGRHFDVLLFKDDLLLLRNEFDGTESLWTIDVSTGIARQVRATGTFRLVKTGVSLRDADGATRIIPLSDLRP